MDKGKDGKQLTLEMYRMRRGYKGYAIGLLSGVFWAFAATFLTLGQGGWPFTWEGITIWEVCVIGATAGAISDIFSGIWIAVQNGFKGKIKEYPRLLRSKSIKFCIISGLLSGPVGMAAYGIAFNLAPSTYVLALAATAPIFGTLMAAIFLKERINSRLWLGMIVVVGGAVLVSWGDPGDGLYPYFIIGLLLGLVNALACPVDLTAGAYGMDLIDPDIACGAKLLIGGISNLLLMVPFLGLVTLNDITFGWKVFANAFTTPGILLFIVAAYFAGNSWKQNYAATNMIGEARAYAANVSFSVWSIPVTLLFSAFGVVDFNLTALGIVGVCVLFLGIVVVIIRPKELLHLRNVEE